MKEETEIRQEMFTCIKCNENQFRFLQGDLTQLRCTMCGKRYRVSTQWYEIIPEDDVSITDKSKNIASKDHPNT